MNIHEAFKNAKEGQKIGAIEGDGLNIFVKKENNVLIYYVRKTTYSFTTSAQNSMMVVSSKTSMLN